MAALMKVQFYEDTLLACGTCLEDAHVSIRHMCDALGVDTNVQLKKLRGKEWATVVFNTMVAEDGKNRELALLALKSVPMWLATIDPPRVSEHVRPKLIRYQQEAHDALAAHFLKLAAPQAAPDANVLLEVITRVTAPLIAAISRLEERVSELQTGTAAALRLTQSQRAMIAAQMTGVKQTAAAEMMGVSERSVRNANRVRRELPALVPAVTQGKIDVKTASEVAKMSTRAELVLRADNPKAAAKQLLACSC